MSTWTSRRIWKGPGADSEETYEPVSEIDTDQWMVLKRLTQKGRLERWTLQQGRPMSALKRLLAASLYPLRAKSGHWQLEWHRVGCRSRRDARGF